MKLQGKKTGEFAGFIGYIDQGTPIVDLATKNTLLTVQYKDAGIKYYRHYKTIAEFNADWEDYEADPDPSYLIVKIEKLENSVKELDRKMDVLRDGINELDERLKTAEEITERLLREDNEQILGKVKRYEPTLSPRVKFERMKQDLSDWIDKNEPEKIRLFFSEDEDGRPGVLFEDRTHLEHTPLVIMEWPTIGLKDGGTYTPDELLITGEAGKE